jgi:hypothetical protein
MICPLPTLFEVKYLLHRFRRKELVHGEDKKFQITADYYLKVTLWNFLQLLTETVK